MTPGVADPQGGVTPQPWGLTPPRLKSGAVPPWGGPAPIPQKPGVVGGPGGCQRWAQTWLEPPHSEWIPQWGPGGALSLYIQRYTVSGFFYVLLRMDFMEGFILFLFYFYFLD